MTEALRRKLKLLSASKASLAFICTHFLSIDARWHEGGSWAASRGTKAHKEIEDAINLYLENGTVPTQGYAASAFHCLQSLGIEDPEVSKHADTELSFASDGASYRTIGRSRDYSTVTEQETVVGTADLVIMEDHALTVVDWKTGDASKAMDQLVLLGALASDGYEDTDPLHILSVHVSEREWDAAIDKWLSIGEARARLSRLDERLRRDPEKVTGPHCYGMYCPHARVCLKVED